AGDRRRRWSSSRSVCAHGTRSCIRKHVYRRHLPGLYAFIHIHIHKPRPAGFPPAARYSCSSSFVSTGVLFVGGRGSVDHRTSNSVLRPRSRAAWARVPFCS
ncbi:hypothetical protein BD311DRAFT_750870, partial [Dichomitus squalens]